MAKRHPGWDVLQAGARLPHGGAIPCPACERLTWPQGWSWDDRIRHYVCHRPECRRVRRASDAGPWLARTLTPPGDGYHESRMDAWMDEKWNGKPAIGLLPEDIDDGWLLPDEGPEGQEGEAEV